MSAHVPAHIGTRTVYIYTMQKSVAAEVPLYASVPLLSSYCLEPLPTPAVAERISPPLSTYIFYPNENDGPHDASAGVDQQPASQSSQSSQSKNQSNQSKNQSNRRQLSNLSNLSSPYMSLLRSVSSLPSSPTKEALLREAIDAAERVLSSGEVGELFETCRGERCNYEGETCSVEVPRLGGRARANSSSNLSEVKKHFLEIPYGSLLALKCPKGKLTVERFSQSSQGVTKTTLVDESFQGGRLAFVDKQMGRVHITFLGKSPPVATVNYRLLEGRVAPNTDFMLLGEREVNEGIIKWLGQVGGDMWMGVGRVACLGGILYSIKSELVDNQFERKEGIDGITRIVDFIKNEIKSMQDRQGGSLDYALSQMAFSQVLKSETGIRVCDEGREVASTTSVHTSCYVTPAIPADGRYTVTFKISQDVSNDESCCLGLGTLPRISCSYNSSSNLYMYRCYNGNLYSKGTQVRGSSREKVHPGDSVDMEVFNGKCEFSVNGESQRGCFEELPEKIYAAVAFYGGNRKVRFVRCVHTGAGKGAGIENYEPGEKHFLGDDIKKWYGAVEMGRKEGPGVCEAHGGYWVGTWEKGKCKGVFAKVSA